MASDSPAEVHVTVIRQAGPAPWLARRAAALIVLALAAAGSPSD